MILSTVDARPIQVALYQGGKWFNWGKSTQAVPVWEVTFLAASHLKALGPDPTFPTYMQTNIPNYAIIQADSMIVFDGSTGQPISTVAIPPNMYLGPWPGTQTLR